MNNGLLPSEYAQVSAITNDGDNYIDTGVYPNGKIRMKGSLELTWTQSGNAAFSGVLHQGFTGIWQVLYRWGNGDTDFNVNGSETVFYTHSYYGSHDFDVNQVSNYIVHNGVRYGILSSLPVQPGHANIPLFRYHNEINPTDNYVYGKLFYIKIWDDNVMVRDYIPCVRRADNIAGLYDLVTRSFATNSGTGKGFGYIQ